MPPVQTSRQTGLCTDNICTHLASPSHMAQAGARARSLAHSLACFRLSLACDKFGSFPRKLASLYMALCVNAVPCVERRGFDSVPGYRTDQCWPLVCSYITVLHARCRENGSIKEETESVPPPPQPPPPPPLHLTHPPTLDRCSPPLKISTSEECQQQECEEFLTKVMKR